MTAEEHTLLLECLVELGQLDPETTPAEQAFDFEVWYSQRQGQVSGEVYYKHILDGAKAWKRSGCSNMAPLGARYDLASRRCHYSGT